MTQWSPPEPLASAAVQIITRAAGEANTDAKRNVQERATRGLTSLGMQKASREAAAQAIRTTGVRATTEVLDLFRSAYGSIPPDALTWIDEKIGQRLRSLGQSHLHALKKTEERPAQADEHYTSKSERIINGAVEDALRDLSIALAPIRINAGKGLSQQEERHVKHTTVYNVTGANSRVNVGSVDASTNIVNTNVNQLFASMREALDSAPMTATDRTELRRRIEELEPSTGTVSFAQKYANFMQLAANHVTVFQPFLPALSQLLIAANGM
jgi:hypothetical protein